MVYDENELIEVVRRDSLEVSLWKCRKDGCTSYPIETRAWVNGSYVFVPRMCIDDLLIASNIFVEMSDFIYQAHQDEMDKVLAQEQMDEAVRVSEAWGIREFSESV